MGHTRVSWTTAVGMPCMGPGRRCPQPPFKGGSSQPVAAALLTELGASAPGREEARVRPLLCGVG